MQYDVSYFINKFEAIPENLWQTKFIYDNIDGKACAAGHCGIRLCNINTSTNELFGEGIEEAVALSKLLRKLGIIGLPYEIIYTVNDGYSQYKQDHPKERILAALADVKKLQQPSYPDITKELAKKSEQENKGKEIDVIVRQDGIVPCVAPFNCINTDEQ